MIVTKNTLKVGQKVKTIWKEKLYEGTIEKLNHHEWAERTKGRFIAIDIKTIGGRIIGMPFTSRAQYEIIMEKKK